MNDAGRGVAATESVVAVPPETGVVSTNPEDLARAGWRFIHDPSETQAVGPGPGTRACVTSSQRH